jgi:hypothetical protein
MDGDPFAPYAEHLETAPAWDGHLPLPSQSGRIRATPFRWRTPSEIPVRQFVYGRHLIRRFLSTTVAPGGVGKSSLVLVEALAMVTGRPLLGIHPSERLRVWYWCGEDPLEEIERRVAAICLHYGIQPEEIEDRLFLDSGRTSEIILATTTKAGAVLAQPVLDQLVETILENEIDVVVIDPFISAHRVSENDNGAVDMVAKALNRVAEETRCAMELIHHVRKGQGGQGGYSVEDGRGAVSLLAAARSARVLNPMTREEAERAEVERPRTYFRVDNGKANLAPPPDRSEWFHLASVSLENGPAGSFDMSDHVAVVEPWEWPDPMANVSVADLRKAQAATADGKWRENPQAADWIGKPIAAALGITLDKAGTAKVKAMLKMWVANGMFVVVQDTDEKRNKRSFVRVGEAAND